jgi:hypothetical protein
VEIGRRRTTPSTHFWQALPILLVSPSSFLEAEGADFARCRARVRSSNPIRSSRLLGTGSTSRPVSMALRSLGRAKRLFAASTKRDLRLHCWLDEGRHRLGLGAEKLGARVWPLEQRLGTLRRETLAATTPGGDRAASSGDDRRGMLGVEHRGVLGRRKNEEAEREAPALPYVGAERSRQQTRCEHRSFVSRKHTASRRMVGSGPSGRSSGRHRLRRPSSYLASHRGAEPNRQLGGETPAEICGRVTRRLDGTQMQLLCFGARVRRVRLDRQASPGGRWCSCTVPWADTKCAAPRPQTSVVSLGDVGFGAVPGPPAAARVRPLSPMGLGLDLWRQLPGGHSSKARGLDRRAHVGQLAALSEPHRNRVSQQLVTCSGEEIGRGRCFGTVRRGSRPGGCSGVMCFSSEQSLQRASPWWSRERVAPIVGLDTTGWAVVRETSMRSGNAQTRSVFPGRVSGVTCANILRPALPPFWNLAGRSSEFVNGPRLASTCPGGLEKANLPEAFDRNSQWTGGRASEYTTRERSDPPTVPWRLGSVWYESQSARRP